VSEVVARRIAWIWERWLAAGELAILEGDPGMNKSRLTLDLCARPSTGRPMPDGSPGPGPANAIVVCKEDAQGTTIRARLEALGADLSRVSRLDARRLGRDRGGSPAEDVPPDRPAANEQAPRPARRPYLHWRNDDLYRPLR
jgi:hypothetical protein